MFRVRPITRPPSRLFLPSCSRSIAQPAPSSSSSSSSSSRTPLPPTPPPSRILRPNAASYSVGLNLPPHFGANQLVPVSEAKLAQLQRIVGSFRAPVRYAFAYGSGIFPQGPAAASGQDDGKQPMLDFIFATTHADHFHSINLQQNPSHYPPYARLAGSEAISWVQRNGGAGVWFNAFCEVEGAMIKYGVITVDQLCKDLIEWETLYCSGRMHKPIRILKDDPRVKLANQVNLASALRVALLMLPEHFTERELYETVAGLSYAGDPRMAVPGGENPRKVANIVEAQMARFQGVYGRLLGELDGLAVVGSGGGKLHQDPSPAHRASLARKLPKNLKLAIRKEYATKAREESTPEEEKELWEVVGASRVLPAQLALHTARITHRPALMQSLKGLITAGPVKSVLYGSAKVGKWRAGRASAGPGDQEA